MSRRAGHARSVDARGWMTSRACFAACAAVCILVVAAGSLSAGDPKGGPAAARTRPEPSVHVETVAGATHVDAAFPGPLKAWAFPAGPGGARRLAVLLGSEDAPAPAVKAAGPPAPGQDTASSGEAKPHTAHHPGAPKPSGGAAGGKKARKTSEGSGRVTFSLGEGRANVAVEPNTPPGGPFSLDETPSSSIAWLDPAASVEGPRVSWGARDLPGNVKAIDAVDVDGDGADEIVMWRPGSIETLPIGGPDGRTGSPRPLVSDPEIQPFSSMARALCDLDCGRDRRLWTTIVGGLRAYGPMGAKAAEAEAPAREGSGMNTSSSSPPREESGRQHDTTGGRSGPEAWGLVEELPLPVAVERRGSGFSLRTSGARTLPAGPGSHAQRFVMGPESFGADRLRTLIIDPSLPAGQNTTESWALLPSPEKVIESAYLSIDGRDALVVTTRSADKLGIFAEKRVRVFFLDADRTRRGHAPAAAMESRINLWQTANPVAVDVDGDGRQDLVLGYWKGLKNNHLVLDAYLRTEDGGFATSARTTSFEVANADRSFLSYGHDLDGDGAPELVLLAGDALLVYPGTLGRKGKDLVAETPRWTFRLAQEGAGSIKVNRPAPSADGVDGADDDDPGLDEDEAPGSPPTPIRPRPRFLDLDADGREEIVLAGPSAPAGGHVQVFAFPRKTP